MHAFLNLATVLLAAVALPPTPSTAEAWPRRTVRIIVPLQGDREATLRHAGARNAWRRDGENP